MEKKKLITIIVSISLVVCIGLTTLIVCLTRNNNPSTIINGTVPIYQGIAFENIPLVDANVAMDDDEDEEDEIDDKDVSDIIVKDFGTIEVEEIVNHGVKSEKAYLTLNFYNPSEYEILSFVMNGTKYQSYQFSEESTSEKIKVAVTLPDTSGVYEYKVEQIKYIDGDDIEDCVIDGNTTVKVGVEHDNPPTSISTIGVNYEGANISINIVDNANIIASSGGKVKIYLFDSISEVDSKELQIGTNEVVFSGLGENKKYKYVVAATYDALDGQGMIPHILESKVFTTLNYANVTISDISKNGINVQVEKNLEDVSIDTIEVIKNGEVIKSSTDLNIAFDGLLSDNDYTVNVKYSYDGKNFVQVSNVHTLPLSDAVVSVAGVPTKNAIKYTVNMNDVDSIVKSYKVELIKDGVVIKSSDALEGTFDTLLSNNTYQIALSYKVDKQDGKGEVEKKETQDIKTEPLATPSCGLNLNLADTSLTGELVVTDVDNIFKLTNIELRTAKNAQLEATILDKNINFTLKPNTSYVVVVNYTYDMNDGTPVKTDKYEKRIVVNKEVPTLEIEVSASDISAYMNVRVTDINSAGAVNSVKLYKKGTFIKDISVTENNITDLTSNTEYKVVVEYRYDFDDGLGAQTVTAETTFTTLKTMPTVVLDNNDITTSSIAVTPTIADNDNAGAITKVELYHKNKLISTNVDTYAFSDLLSNNDYVIKCYYGYDLNNGADEIVVTKNVKTLANAVPAIDILLLSTSNKITYEFKHNETGIVPTLVNVEIFRNDIKYAELADKTGEFADLMSDNEYVIKATYTYDLKDGLGVVTSVSEATIMTKPKTAPKIGIEWDNLIDVLAEGHIIVSDTEVNAKVTGILLYKDASVIASVMASDTFSFAVQPNMKYSLLVKYNYDLNNGVGAVEAEETFEFTSTNQIPTVNIVIGNVAKDNITYNLYFNDDNNKGALKGIKLYQGGMFIKQMNEFDTEITGLSSNTEYKFVVDYLYDLNDGKGSRTAVYEKTFKTLKTMPSYSMSLAKDGTSISVSHNMTDVDGVATFKSVKLYLSNTGELVSEKTDINDNTFTGLLNGNGYRVVVTFDYDLNNGAFAQEFSDYIYIDALDRPWVNFNVTADKKDIKFSYTYTDNDSVVCGKDVNVYKGGKTITIDKVNGTATGLLSNNEYEIRVTMKCDFNDGRGVVEENYSRYITTEALAVPSLTATFLSTQTTITPKYEIVDEDNIVTIDSVDILKDGTLIKNSAMSESLVFDGLTANSVYTFKTHFSYDLNDGNGVHNDVFESSFSTLAYDVKVNGHAILNDRAPKTNENISLRLDIENKSNVTIKEVKVNGTYYAVTGGNNTNNIIIAIDSGDRSGIRNYSIEEMKYELNGYNVNQVVTYAGSITVEVFSRLNVLSVMAIDGMSIAKKGSGMVFEIDNPNGYEIVRIVQDVPERDIYVEKIADNHYYAAGGYWVDSRDRVIYIGQIDYINENGELATRTYTDSVMLPMVYVEPDNTTNTINTHEINTPEELLAMSNGSYILGSDIDMTGYTWTPKSFSGVFDGRGHKISNIKYTYETETNDIWNKECLFTSISGTFKNVYFDNIYLDIAAAGGIRGYFVKNGDAVIENLIVSGGVNMKTSSWSSFEMPTGTNIYVLDSFKVNSQSYAYDNTINLETLESKEFRDNILHWNFKPIKYKDYNGLKYLVVNNAYVFISKYEGSETNVVVPDTIEGLPVAAIGDFAFANCTTMASITLSNNIVYIGGSVFDKCSALSIYAEAASKPAGWGSEWNSYCPVKWNIKQIGNNGDYNWVVYNDGIVEIEKYIGSATIADIPSQIGELTISRIGDAAFEGCSALERVTIPSSVTSIGDSTFSGCSSLNRVDIKDISAWCNISFGGSNANPLSYAHNLYLNGELVTNLKIPSNVTNINDYAFNGCGSLISVTIPSSVTSIGSFAFFGCTSLTSITIPNSVTSIGQGAFFGCTSLTSINIPRSVTSISRSAFWSCESLTIFAEADAMPDGWSYDWNERGGRVVWYGCDGNDYTYTFNTNGGNEILPITAKGVVELPTPTKEGWHFGGWYDNVECIGEPVAPYYYNKGGATLYAKWLTKE